MIYNYNGDYNMKAVTVNCPNCKAPFDFKDNLKQTKCEHCGSLVFPTKELKEEALNNNSLEAVKALMENNNFKEAYLRCVRILKNDPTNCEALRYKIVTRLKKMITTYDLKEDGKSYKINDLMNYDFIDPLKLDLYNLKCDLEELEKIDNSSKKFIKDNLDLINKLSVEVEAFKVSEEDEESNNHILIIGMVILMIFLLLAINLLTK